MMLKPLFLIFISVVCVSAVESSSVIIDQIVKDIANGFRAKNSELIMKHYSNPDKDSAVDFKNQMNSGFEQVDSIHVNGSGKNVDLKKDLTIWMDLTMFVNGLEFKPPMLFFKFNQELKIISSYTEDEMIKQKENTFTSNVLHTPDNSTLSESQKAYGFMVMWNMVKYNFVGWGQMTETAWDTVLYSAYSEAINAQTNEEYFKILQRCVALLNDGHCNVWYPRNIRPPFPFNLRIISGKVIVTETIHSEKPALKPGDEILEINDRSLKMFVEEEVLPFHSRSSEHDIVGAYKRAFEELQSDSVMLKIRTPSGKMRTVNSIRTKAGEFIPWHGRPILDAVWEKDSILRITINTFDTEQVVHKFDSLFQSHVMRAKGLIFDLRENGGGNSSFGNKIIGFLIEKQIESERVRSLYYSPMHASFGFGRDTWEEKTWTIKPSNGKKYAGPIAILQSPHTYSAAEDFIVPLHYNKRAIVVGERSGGSTGNPIHAQLPGGASIRVCTMKIEYPDGTQFVGTGIRPDYEVIPTRKDIAEKRDPVLKKALEILNEEGLDL